MKQICPYHQQKNKKNKQGPQKSLSRSQVSDEQLSWSSRKNMQTNIQRLNNSNLFNNQTEFNDYYFDSADDKTKRIKIYAKEPQKNYLIVNKQCKDSGNSRFCRTLGQQYFDSEENYLKSTKINHKNRLESSSLRTNQSKKTENSQKMKDEAKIVELQKQLIQQSRKIRELNSKIELCEKYQKKNHYEFVLLRSIVSELKIQNLELVSRMCVIEEILKKQIRLNPQTFLKSSLCSQKKRQNLIEPKQSFQKQENSLTEEFMIENFKKVNFFQKLGEAFAQEKQQNIQSNQSTKVEPIQNLIFIWDRCFYGTIIQMGRTQESQQKNIRLQIKLKSSNPSNYIQLSLLPLFVFFYFFYFFSFFSFFSFFYFFFFSFEESYSSQSTSCSLQSSSTCPLYF